ncbi:hydantoinase/oxoprolinase family protein [Microbacterium suwonense]|uniref:Methylhydantoinase n=1 Tax=Microbacterium suwonense TaxID=683047 RepID=A0ABM8FWE5_9MICO|nr:hydantoinase/oxoprolinase family protein [Microbacterium suwonense]BDZ39988.1 methylhydantoinase [Microbacterium suwonense]
MTLRIGVDTGGTFTDICAFDEETARVHVRKVSSTPDDPGRAIVQGVEEILDQIGGREISEVGYFAHGTTVGTNALLTGRGAVTGLITTRGFRDLLELGRGRRPSMYDPQADKPAPQVPRHLRKEVAERVRHTGAVETPLDEDDVRRAVRELRAEGVQSIAVCLLYSYLNPDHERRIGEIIAEEMPGVYVSLSSDVLPEFREFERLSTVVTNSYVGPVVANYLARLRAVLADRGLTAVPHVTQSNGGVIPFSTAESLPVRLVLSGPSTGVVGAAQICSAAGFDDIITFDMGGTSSDISLVQDGRPKVTAGMELDGRPVRSPMLDIHTVGAGGGSLAWIDSGGHLRVGPQSAGSFPGPACYGNGGGAAVTDANVVLRMLNPEYLLNGQMKIDREASLAAVRLHAEQLGLGVEETALGILRVVTANMARAIRVVSVQRGYDPRDYALVPFGGAGPLHASRLARELGMRRMVVPEIPGAQSALGLLMTDVKTDFMRTQITLVDESTVAQLDDVFAELSDRAADWFAEEDIDTASRELLRRMDLRYRGQNFELAIDLPEEHRFAQAGAAPIVELFHEAHERVYGYRSEDVAVEVVTFRVEAAGAAAHVEVRRDELTASDPLAAVIGVRKACFVPAEGYVETHVYDRARLTPGDVIAGPAIIEQMDTTTVLLPGDSCRVDAYRNLIIEIGDEE